MSILRPIETLAKRHWTDISWSVSMLIASWREPAAVEFYRRLKTEAYAPDYLINVLPQRSVIYLVVPKAASTRIRATLAAVAGRYSLQLKPNRWGKLRGPQGPRSMTARSFYRLATNPATLRFSFVRNPYARAVSCWADKFQNKPLVPGVPMIGGYLARREQIDSSLPAGADKTLSFEQFVTFIAAVATTRENAHFQLQADILSMPGIALDFIGRVENYNADFARVLDHVGASEQIRREALVPMNPSRRRHWAEYYTPELAGRIYRAYEPDFDRFGYPRALPG